jgi:hypothetical protein
VGGDLVAWPGEVHEHDIAELSLRVVGDSDLYDGGIAGAGDVLVLGGVDQLVRYLGHGCSR